MSRTALIVIDVQNDYFPGGAFPLHGTEAALQATLQAMAAAQRAGVPVVLVQHVADASKGVAPLFNAGTPGVEIHPQVRAAAPDALVVVKRRADSFRGTTLASTLQALGVDAIVLAGMMTHNCVTHTALSKAAERYHVSVLPAASATVSPMLQAIALSALGDRVPLVDVAQALG